MIIFPHKWQEVNIGYTEGKQLTSLRVFYRKNK